MHYKKYKSILSASNGMNLYRGCSHGCIYCDSRSKCYQMDHEFTDIEIKEDAVNMLDYELSKKRKPVMVGTGAMTDPYMHIEKATNITRDALKVILKHHCGVSILTKSDLILRDIDLFDQINRDSKAVVEVTLTTANEELCKIVEPNVATTKQREEILRKCDELHIPTIVWLCPILPFINDNVENLMSLLDICSKHHVYGIIFFGFGVTLREGNREYFYQKLDESFPGLKQKYIKTYGNAYECSSLQNERLTNILVSECKKRNIILNNDELFKFMATYPIKEEQLSLFDL